MLVLYTRTELGFDDPNATDWLTETIGFVKYERSGIDVRIKNIVNKYADGDKKGTYKHYVPYDRILKTLINGLEGRTRGQIIGDIDTVMNKLNVKDNDLLDPQSNRAAFDTWVEWAIEVVCDYPPNIYRWSQSTGDGGGTKLDAPTNAPQNLMNRLTQAAQALQQAIRVSLKQTEPRV